MIDQKTFKVLQGSFFLSCLQALKISTRLYFQIKETQILNYTNGLKVRLEFAQLY